MLGAAQALVDTIGPDKILVDAEESRQFSAGVDKLQEYRDTGQLGDEVVVQLGTNGTVNPEEFDRMMGVLKGVKRVVIVNAKVPRPWEDQVNEVLANGVKETRTRYSSTGTTSPPTTPSSSGTTASTSGPRVPPTTPS
jgi:hypothetical protein